MTDPPASAVPPPPAARPLGVLGAVALGLIVAVALGSALYGIAGPLAWGHHGHHAGNHGNDAKHLLRDGTMVQQWDPGYHAPAGRYYLHHPILLHQYIAGTLLVLGPHVWSLRVVPACFSLLLVLLIFHVGRRAWGVGAGLMGAAVFALLPMVAAFNILPDHQHPASFYTIAGFYLYLRWLETRARWHLALALGSFLLVAFTDWTPYLITLFFGMYLVIRALWTRRRADVVGIVGLVLAFAIPLATHFALVKLLGAESDMAESFSQRSGGPGIARIAELMFENQLRMYTAPVVWLTGLWLVTVLVRAPLGALRKWHAIPLCILVAQTLYIFLFRQGVYVHIYRTYYAGIVYAFAAADLLALLVLGLRAVGTARLGRVLPAALAAVLGIAFLGLEARASYPIWLESRAKAGSIGHQGYNPDLERLVFGRFVNELTTPQDLVLVHSSFRARYEFHWYLDRDVRATTVMGEPLPRRRSGRLLGTARGLTKPPAPAPAAPRGAFLIAAESSSRGGASALLRKHPCYRVGPYLLFDLRREGGQYRSYRLASEAPRGLLARFLGGPHQRQWRLVRDLEDEWRVVLANQLPVEDRPPPARPKGNDRNSWVRWAQVMAALGHPQDARDARARARDTLRPARPAADLGDGLRLDAAVWSWGSPFHVLLHATRVPTHRQALLLELERIGPPLPPALPRPELRPVPLAPPPALLGAGLTQPPFLGPRRYERPLAPPTTQWVVEHTQLELWSIRPPPGTYRARLRLRPFDGGEPLVLPPPVELGIVDAR